MNYTLREILLILLGVAIVLPLYIYLEKDPVVSNFFKANKTTLLIFLFLFIVLVFISAKIFQDTLDCTDEETLSTLKISKINVLLWSLFWVAWSVTNVVFLVTSSIGIKLIILSVLLTNVPGILLFLITYSIRKDQLSDYPALQAEDGIITVFKGEQQSLSFRYFSGFYGLITLPVYGLGCLGYYLF